MGKRQIGEIQMPEFVAAVLLSELASLPITDVDIPIMHGIIPVLTIASLEIVIAYICRKSSAARKILDGMPIVLVANGNVVEDNLTKARISLDEIFAQIRIDGYKDMSDIQYVILEQTGKMSVLPKAQASAVTLSDMNIKSPDKGYGHMVIIDGAIREHELEAIGKDKAWLYDKLYTMGYKRVETVLYMTVDDTGNVSAAPRAEKRKGNK